LAIEVSVVAAAGAASYTLPAGSRSASGVSVPAAGAITSNGAHSGSRMSKTDLAITLDVDQVVNASGVRSADLVLSVGHYLPGRDTHARYTLELFDHRGKRHFGPVYSDMADLSRENRNRTFRLTLPFQVADGWYVARVTVVAREGAATAEGIAELYWSVLDGQPVLVPDYHDFFTGSGMFIGTRADSVTP
jgi:hypothetical protein